jgi:hypothetical protein
MMDSAAGRPRGVPAVNFILVMRNEKDELVAIGPVAIEYQAAMLRDELEEGNGWTTIGIARVLTQDQARRAVPAE